MKKINYLNIRKNIEKIDEYSNKNIIAVVKNDAYNTGLFETLQVITGCGINYIMMVDIGKAVQVREAFPELSILLSDPLAHKELEEIKDYQFDLIIDSYEYLIANHNLLKNHNLHLKINSSMNRFGIEKIGDAKDICRYANKHQLKLIGLMTHMSLEEENSQLFEEQVAFFGKIYESTKDLVDYKIIHGENSYTFLKKVPQLAFCNYARIGLLLYGYNSSKYQLDLKPSVSFHTEVIKIRRLPAGKTFSYGLDNIAEDEKLIAICRHGYGDGILRERKKLPVYINNRQYSIVGKVSMSHLYVEVDEHVEVGDSVEIYGEHVSVLNQAQISEIPTSLVMSYLH